MNKKSQMSHEAFKYIIMALVALTILIFGYMMFRLVQQRGCAAELSDFEINMINIGKGSRYGDKALKTYKMPCSVNKIYLFDLTQSINAAQFSDVPIMAENLRTLKKQNIFLVEGSGVEHSFYAGNLQIEQQYFCLKPLNGKISLYAEGSGDSLKISKPENQPECA